MVKSLIPVLVALLLLSGAAVYEQIYVRSSFEELREQAVIMQEKEFSGTATVSFVSHNDIKELDMWLSEGVAFTKNGKYDEAYTKYVVIADLCRSIPKGYLIRFENVF